MIPSAKQSVTLAQSQVGYKCKGKKDKYAKEIDKNYPTFYNGKKYGCADWCAIFNDWTVLHIAKSAKDAEKVLCQPAKSAGAGVGWSYKYYKAKKRTTKTPHYGDEIFLKNSKGKLSHTGKVYKVNSKYVWYTAGNETTVVKGKKYQTVKKHKILRTNKKIYGYGRPKYATA